MVASFSTESPAQPTAGELGPTGRSKRPRSVVMPTPALMITLLIGTDELCIGQHVPSHCALDL